MDEIDELEVTETGLQAVYPAAEAASQPKPPARLWRNGSFLVVFLGQGVSNVGDAVRATALPLLVLQLTGSGLAMGVVGMLQALPGLVVGPPAGAIADRWDRRRVMFAADCGRALLTALIPLSLWLRIPTMPVVYAVAFPVGVLAALFSAGYIAAVPTLVGREQYGRATSYFEALESLAWMIGPGVAGLLATRIGPGPVLLLDAVSFALSALSLTLVRRPLQMGERAPTQYIVRDMLTDMREGLRFIATHRALRAGVGLWVSARCVVAPLVVAITYAITVDRRLGPSAVGFALSAYAAGSLVGTLLGGRMDRWRPGPLMLLANTGTALALVLLAVSPNVAVALAAALLFGVFEGMMLVVYLTFRAALTPDALMGRVGATASSLSLGLQSLGMFAGGALLQVAGGAATLAAMGALVLAISLAFATVTPLLYAKAIGAHVDS
jgi:MFS family permease